MTAGICLLGFGEPDDTSHGSVVEFLARIFYTNAVLEDAPTDEARWQRSYELAERRAPGLIEEYEAIGGSPHNPQCDAQARLVEGELSARGFDVEAFVGLQYTPPFIEDMVQEAQNAGVDRLVAIPVYPHCGPSTTVAALGQLRRALAALDWDVPVHEVTGWHRHPRYTRLRADNVRRFLDDRGLSTTDPGTAFVFSAHGTPIYYVEKGFRYVGYVEEYCDAMAKLLGLSDYGLGYQNHANRGIEWTEPEVDDVVAQLNAKRVIVEPISFMHEQSETLNELDIELREVAEANDLDFHRVPIPHDDPQFGEVLADLAEPFVAEVDPGYYQLRQCQCRPEPGTRCLNALVGP